MRGRSLTLLLLVLIGVPSARAEDPHPGTWVRILETRPREEWDDAIDGLLALKRLPRQSVSTLVRRMDAMDTDDRRRFAKGLYYKVARPETLEAAIRLLGDIDGKTAKLARSAIASCKEDFVAPILTAHLGKPHPRLDWIALLLEDLWYDNETVRRQTDEIDGSMVLADIAAGRTFEIFDALAPLLSDPDAVIRLAALECLWYIGDVRIRSRVFRLTRDRDPAVQNLAWRVLAWHGDTRALEPLLEWADASRSKESRWYRNKRFDRVGGLHRHWRYTDLFELYRTAQGEEQRLDYGRVIHGGLDTDILRNPATMAVMERYASDSDPVIRGVAEKVLRWRDRRKTSVVKEGLGVSVLVSTCLLAGLLGLVLFHWAFRLLGLRRLFRSLTPSPIRSLALGHVAVGGQVRALGHRIEHPYTGEPCVYYPGADRDHPDLRFAVDDGTGQVVVDPHKLVMLSGDGILEPGEEVLLVGTARRHGDSVKITKDDAPRPLYQRCVHFVVRHVLGRAARSGSARLLFTDPGRCFCLWDDLHEKPFACWRDNATTFGAIALMGMWVLVFALATLAIVDQELSATLRESLERFWSANE